MFWPLAPFAIASAGIVDRVVVTVGDELVMASELEREQALNQHDLDGSPFWRQGDFTERLIDAAIVRERAGDIALYKPSDEVVRKRLDGIRSRFADRASWVAFLDRWSLDDDALSAILRRRVLVERYLERNIAVGRSDLMAWWSAVEAHLAEIRLDVRIRKIAPIGPPR